MVPGLAKVTRVCGFVVFVEKLVTAQPFWCRGSRVSGVGTVTGFESGCAGHDDGGTVLLS